MNNSPDAIGRRLLEARRAKGLTQVQVQKILGIHPNTLSELERGDFAAPTLKKIEKLALLYKLGTDLVRM